MEINWEAMEGYSEGLSSDDKLALLDKYESKPPAAPDHEKKQDEKQEEILAAPRTGKVIAKSQFDKVASELAAAKKSLRAKMSEDETKELDRQQEQESVRLELETLRKEKAMSEYKSSYLALGFDETLAANSASALSDGDLDAVFADMKKHAVGLEKTLRAKILKETPTPPAGDNAELGKKDLFEETFKKG